MGTLYEVVHFSKNIFVLANGLTLHTNSKYKNSSKLCNFENTHLFPCKWLNIL